MMYLAKILIITMAVIVSLYLMGEMVVAGDLDDGISTYQDESIEEDNKLGDADVNINFIVLDAISSAKMNQDDDYVNINDGSGDSNQNSVICEAGAECGSIVNIEIDR